MTTSPRATAMLVVIAAVAGLAVAVAPLVAVGAALVVLAVAAGLVFTVRPLSRLVVVASFLNRIQLPGPLPLLLEHCAALTALPAALRERSFRRAITAAPVVFFALFIGWSALVSLLRSPDPGQSFRIVGWLALDLVVLVVIVVAQYAGENPIATGVTTAGWIAVVGIVVGSASLAGLSTLGTQLDSLTGARSLYLASYEANIFGSLMAMWLFVVITGQRSPTRSARVQKLLALAMLAALLLSLTRAAILGLLVGIVVWKVLMPANARRRWIMLRLSGVAAVVLVVLFAVPALSPIRERVGELTDLSSGTGQQRVESWKTAIGDLDLGSVVTGLGTNSFGQRHLDPSLPTKPTPAYLANLPLQIVYDSGVVGFLLLLCVLVSALPRSREGRARAYGLFAVFLVSSLATSSLWFATTWIFVARGAFLRRPMVARSGTGSTLNVDTDVPG